jgi:hypothetical protein
MSVYHEERRLFPTAEQGISRIRVCQMLSNSMQDIHLFRFDDLIGEIYILAGKQDDLEIVIYLDETWEFISEAKL